MVDEDGTVLRFAKRPFGAVGINQQRLHRCGDAAANKMLAACRHQKFERKLETEELRVLFGEETGGKGIALKLRKKQKKQKSR